MPRHDWDDDDYDRPRRRRRYEGERSGSVTGVGVFGIVVGSLDLLLGMCLLMAVVIAGSHGGPQGAFIGIPLFGEVFAMMIIFTLIVLVWGSMAITASVGVLNRSNWGRIMTLIVSGFGGVASILFLIGAFVELSRPAAFGMGNPRVLGFFINFLIFALLLTYCIWAFVALLNRRNAEEFR
ncbi:MAG: hypothetical protein L0Y72_28480 [Gemmataceae bacterium]|nr:hypothetical protein [Gemmataceae bacterium]MCI0742985.1 hypothetical protein [Gemmataceae bacterium]